MSWKNRILDGMSDVDLKGWGDALALIEFRAGKILFDSSIAWEYVYFPIDCIISLSSIGEDGAYDCFSLIGNDGMVGVGIFLGDTSGGYCAQVELGGKAYSLPFDAAIKEFGQSSQFRILILKYFQALVSSSLQAAICEHGHTDLQRLSCALLVCDDYSAFDKTPLNPMFIEKSLGITSDQMKSAVAELKSQKLIVMIQRRIIILDRVGLEKCACECYGLVRGEFERMLPFAASDSHPLH